MKKTSHFKNSFINQLWLMNPIWMNWESYNHSMKYILAVLYKFAVCLHDSSINENKSNAHKAPRSD